MIGRTVVLITHGPGWSGGADRTVLLDQGRLVLAAGCLGMVPGPGSGSATGPATGSAASGPDSGPGPATGSGPGPEAGSGPGARPLAAAP
jgi:hypothetical protein